MLRKVLPGEPDRQAVLDRLVNRASTTDPAIERAVREVVGDVRARGDAAVRDWTLRFEQRALLGFEIERESWRRAASGVAPGVKRALACAHQRIAQFHAEEAERLHRCGFEMTDAEGARLALRIFPLSRVGIYAPGGTARYPSSVLMGAVPARAAGVDEIVLTCPQPSPEVLLAAELSGVHRVFALGGAQAIAALAYGTESVPRVDKIVGPGNAYVAAAKRLVFGDVAIDQIAGPSEVLILADDSANPIYVAADLLAQAEHDTAAYPVLVTTSSGLADAVVQELEQQIATLPRRAIAEAAVRNQGAAIVVESLDEAVALAEAFAPEHIELHLRGAEAIAAKLRCAGAIFLGAFTPEAAGDYLAGPNHVLPTGGSARFGSPLGVHDFLKRTSVLAYSQSALAAQAGDIVELARVEGLEGHGRAVELRLGPQ